MRWIGSILMVLQASWALASAQVPSCAQHSTWVAQLAGWTSQDPACEGQRQHALGILRQGLQICEQRRKQLDPNCDSRRATTANFLPLANFATQDQVTRQAESLNSQYEGLVQGMTKNTNSCLRRLARFRDVVACKLPLELGQKVHEASAWDRFWNRAKSRAPFEDSISPEVRLGITTIASAALWRFRGSGLFADPNNSMSTMRRGVTALGYIGMGYFNGGMDGAIAGGLLTPGLFLPYGKHHALKNKWRDTAAMTAIGGLTTALPSAYLAARGYNSLPLLAGGLAKGPCYFAGKQWTKDSLDWSPDKQFLGGVHTQFGELCNGATIGAGLSGSLLYGRGEDNTPPPEDQMPRCDQSAH
jgi:hypothetical protein